MKNGYDPDFFAELVKYEAANFWFYSRNCLIVWALQRYFPKVKNFFEIGYGTGFVLQGISKAFPHIALYGTDIYTTGLDYAKKRLNNARLFQMDARNISFTDEFDVIGAFDLLEHVKEDDLVLSQMHKATRQNGGIMLAVPQHSFLWSRVDENACHLRRYNAQKLKAKVERAGFKVLDMISFVSWLLPLMMIVRLGKRGAGRNYSVIDELKLDSLSNMILKKILDFERFLIRLGIRLPFGGSLLLIAQKT